MSKRSEDGIHLVPGYPQTSSKNKGQSQGPRSLSSTFSSKLPSLTGRFEERHRAHRVRWHKQRKKGTGFERKRILFFQEFPNRAGTHVFLFQAKGTRNKTVHSCRVEEE